MMTAYSTEPSNADNQAAKVVQGCAAKRLSRLCSRTLPPECPWPSGKHKTGTLPLGETAKMWARLFFTTTSRCANAMPLACSVEWARLA